MCKKRKLGSVWCPRLNMMISDTGKRVYVDPVSLTSSKDNTGAPEERRGEKTALRFLKFQFR